MTEAEKKAVELALREEVADLEKDILKYEEICATYRAMIASAHEALTEMPVVAGFHSPIPEIEAALAKVRDAVKRRCDEALSSYEVQKQARIQRALWNVVAAARACRDDKFSRTSSGGYITVTTEVFALLVRYLAELGDEIRYRRGDG